MSCPPLFNFMCYDMNVHILVALPTPENVHNEFAFGNLPQIVNHTKKVFPDVKITFANKEGVRTDANRNSILKQAIEDGTVDYILWLDVDELYPPEIIERYIKDTEELKQTIDVIGCLYFKRSYPYDPVAYTFSGEHIKPYKTLLPSAVEADKIYEIDGLGYGGMMVNMKVYEKLGKKRWTNYGLNFHLPYEVEEHLTHDLVFCRDVKRAGMSVKLHGAVRPGHLATIPITIDHWKKATLENFDFLSKQPTIMVVIPTTNLDQAKQAAEVMKLRAGLNFDLMIIEDTKRIGYVKTLNYAIRESKHDVIIYTAQDALVGTNWLRHAILKMLVENAGLVGFHDGKWNGQLASFGAVQMSWAKHIYQGDIFYPEYHSHYADTELTQIAKSQGRYAYAENAVMLEVDFAKATGKGGGVVKADKKLFKERKESGFDGLVTDQQLLEEFS